MLDGGATGSITFLDGNTVLGSATLTLSGQALFSTSALSVGTHSLTATYAGDASYSAATSATTNETVQPIISGSDPTTDLTLTGPSGNAPANQTFTVTAVVAHAGSTAAGSVQFFNGSNSLGIVALDNTGQAILTVPSLVPGQYTFSAIYTSTDSLLSSNNSLNELVGTANQRYINQIYQDLFHRDADAVGLQTWVTALNSGATKTQVSTAIVGSREYQGNLVDSFYVTYLGRHAETAGLTAWVDQMQAGLSAETIRAGILGSDEYYLHVGQDKVAFVTALYQTFLDRSPEPFGLAAWTGIITSDPTTRVTVAEGIANSEENHMDLVRSYYTDLLHRPADAAGLAQWVAALDAGVPQASVVVAFLTSGEYIARAG